MMINRKSFFESSKGERAKVIEERLSALLEDETIDEISGFLFLFTLTEVNGAERTWAISAGFLDGKALLDYALEIGALQQVVTI